MQVRAADLLTVWVAMRAAAEIQTDQHDHLSRPVLVLPSAQINQAAADVEQELLPLVHRLQGD